MLSAQVSVQRRMRRSDSEVRDGAISRREGVDDDGRGGKYGVRRREIPCDVVEEVVVDVGGWWW